MALDSYTDGRERLLRKPLARMRSDQPAVYQMIILGRMASEWAVTFGSLELQIELAKDGTPITVLRTTVIDQAALHGLLQEIRDLGLTLLLVEYLDTS